MWSRMCAKKPHSWEAKSRPKDTSSGITFGESARDHFSASHLKHGCSLTRRVYFEKPHQSQLKYKNLRPAVNRQPGDRGRTCRADEWLVCDSWLIVGPKFRKNMKFQNFLNSQNLDFQQSSECFTFWFWTQCNFWFMSHNLYHSNAQTTFDIMRYNSVCSHGVWISKNLAKVFKNMKFQILQKYLH